MRQQQENRRRCGFGALLVGLLLIAPLGTSSAAYPDKSVQIVVPYSAGGSTDSTARLVASGLSEKLNQPFVVVNRPGAGGMIAHGEVARATPDGYTLLFSAAGPLTVTPHSYENMTYDP